jgi:ATP-dependent helicase HepA
VISPGLDDLAEKLPFTDFVETQLDIAGDGLGRILDAQREGIDAMLAQASQSSSVRFDAMKRTAIDQAGKVFDAEIHRLTQLKKLNPAVRVEEIEYFRLNREAVLEALNLAELRLDAIRIIVAA